MTDIVTGATKTKATIGPVGPDDVVIGIVGNPNCGKTTLFNQLTGARQRVGNWPGVTVDRKVGGYRHGGRAVRATDLPGVYSLGLVPGMESLDEKIGRDYILSGEADVVVNIVDATNLERNLYLTAQILEMQVPTVVAVNMMDVARKQGIEVDAEVLAERLGCPVVPIVASQGHGIAELREAIDRIAGDKRPPTATVPYAAPVERLIDEVLPRLDQAAAECRVDRRWLAVKMLERDDMACHMAAAEAKELLMQRIPEAEAELGEDMDTFIADGRFAFANALTRDVVRKAGRVGRSRSDAVDRVILNRWLGLPIFLGVMYLMFMFTINLGGAFIDFFDIAAGTLFVDGAGAVLAAVGAPTWLTVLVADGVGGGIQVVATFIPIIGFLYLFLSFLEDSGYMARAAFLMDRYLRAIGLPGKAFVPLIVGFGCNVPAIMGTRTLERQRDRTMAVMMSPFMSCGARLAVYALFAAAFFPVGGQNVVFVLYLVGIAVAIATGLVLKHTLLRGETTHFLMEMPPYHVPQLKSVLLHAWLRLKTFIFGAGKVIVAVVVVLSFLNSWGTDGSFGNEDSEKSVLSAIGRSIVPVFEPMGIDDRNWPATVGIFTGIFAKEAVVGTLDSLYSSLAESDAAANGGPAEDEAFDLWGGLGEAVDSVPANLAGIVDLVLDPLGLSIVASDSLEAAAEEQEVALGTFGAMASRFDGRIGAFAYMLFILLYFPCVAALGAVNREVGPRWSLFIGLWTTGVAYAAAVGVYQAATFARDPAASATWLLSLAAILAVTIAVMRYVGLRDKAGQTPLPAE